MHHIHRVIFTSPIICFLASLPFNLSLCSLLWIGPVAYLKWPLPSHLKVACVKIGTSGPDSHLWHHCSYYPRSLTFFLFLHHQLKAPFIIPLKPSSVHPHSFANIQSCAPIHGGSQSSVLGPLVLVRYIAYLTTQSNHFSAFDFFSHFRRCTRQYCKHRPWCPAIRIVLHSPSTTYATRSSDKLNLQIPLMYIKTSGHSFSFIDPTI